MNKNSVMVYLSFIVLGFSIWAGIKNLHFMMFLCFSSFALLLLFANLDRVEFLKAGKSGIEAKTREIDKVVDNAKSTLNELKLLTKIVGNTTLSLVQKSSRVGGYGEDEKQKIASSIKEIFKKVGLSEDDQDVAFQDWHRYVLIDYCFFLLESNKLSPLSQDQDKKIDQLRGRIAIDRPSPEEIESFLKNSDSYNSEIKEFILDYEHYAKFNEHRRLKAWINKHSWAKEYYK